MATFTWYCPECAAPYATASLLRGHVMSIHHPLNGAIDYLMTRNGADALTGQPQDGITRRRRLLINLIGERAYDAGLTRTGDLS